MVHPGVVRMLSTNAGLERTLKKQVLLIRTARLLVTRWAATPTRRRRRRAHHWWHTW